MKKRGSAGAWLAHIAASCFLLVGGTVVAAPPVARVRPVIDDYFGTQVVDEYRYLENLEDPQVQAWMKAQAEFTRSTLDALPGRARLQERTHALVSADLDRRGFVRRGQRLFYLMQEPGAQLPKLMFRDSLDGNEHTLVDPLALAHNSGTHFALDFFQPSWDGRLVAYGLSRGGSGESVLHMLEVDTGKDLGEAIDRTSDSVVTWRPDNRSFFYLRYGKVSPSGVPRSTGTVQRSCKATALTAFPGMRNSTRQCLRGSSEAA